MPKKTLISAAIGTAFVATMSAAPIALAADNPFALSGLSAGYQVAQAAAKGTEGKCGEGKCGGAKGKEGKCGEGKCGASMTDTDNDGKISKAEYNAMFAKKDTNKDGKVSKAEHNAMFAKKDTNKDGFIDKAEMGKIGEGKCGEGKCGGAKAKEGKCGEGKCGGKK